MKVRPKTVDPDSLICLQKDYLLLEQWAEEAEAEIKELKDKINKALEMCEEDIRSSIRVELIKQALK